MRGPPCFSVCFLELSYHIPDPLTTLSGRSTGPISQCILVLADRAQYTDAETFYQRAIAIGEKTLGPEHPDLAVWLNNIGSLYRIQGKYVEAEPLFRRALTITEKVSGPEHPSLAIRLNNLALLYKTQGQYEQAEPLYQRAIAIFEKVFGPTHPSTITVRKNYEEFLRQWKKGG